MIARLKALNSLVDVRPRHGSGVFQLSQNQTQDTVAVTIGPVVFKVPERGRHRAPNLFVYLRGLLEFDRAEWSSDNGLVTTKVKTQTAHFRLREKSLKGVHGAHYDYEDDLIGHPFFHIQVDGKLEEAGEVVRECFNLAEAVDNSLGSLLPNVRSSSAQVDAFCFLLQIAADHLLPADADQAQRDIFRGLCELDSLCGPACRGTATQSPPSPRPSGSYCCFRARHWYGKF